MNERILIDLSAAVNQDAGIGRYARELTRELIPLLPAAQASNWVAFDPDPAYPDLLADSPWSSLPSRRSRLSRRTVDRLARYQKLHRGSLLGCGDPHDSYSPDFTTPPGRREHVTIHDLAWLRPEAETSDALAAYLQRVVRRAVRNATTIFTVSDAMRTEILNQYDLPGDRVITAANAPGSRFFSARCLQANELAAVGIDRPFLLFVGTIEPRKNLPLALKAMPQLPADLKLVVVGREGVRAREQFSPLEQPEIGSRVLNMGFVTDELLLGLYASASAVVYPSRYEGFGLPVVEGLATGTPVVASDIPVFHEVGGDEVDYFDPLDLSSYVHAIERSLDSSRSSSTARKRRQEQAREFDWKRSAQIVAGRLQEFG